MIPVSKDQLKAFGFPKEEGNLTMYPRAEPGRLYPVCFAWQVLLQQHLSPGGCRMAAAGA